MHSPRVSVRSTVSSCCPAGRRARPGSRRRPCRRRGWPTPSGQPGQAQRHHPGACDRLRRGFLEIQQAEQVFPALADNHLAALDPQVGVGPIQFPVELPLQIAGIGADPDRATILLRPQRRRRDVAERLADTGAGLGENQARLACLAGAVRTRRRRVKRTAAAAAAARPPRQATEPAEHAPQPASTGHESGAASAGAFVPFRQPLPHPQRILRPPRRLCRGSQRRKHGRAPSASRHAPSSRRYRRHPVLAKR